MSWTHVIRVVLADDHEIVRAGIKTLLEAEGDFEVVGQTGDGIEAVRLVNQLDPDVLVADLRMPGMGGHEVAKTVTRERPSTRVVILSMYSDESTVFRALKNGATGYVLKECGFDRLLDAIRSALAGRRYLCPRLLSQAIESYARDTEFPPDPYDTLTTREREVFHLAAEGASAAEIAKRLFISRRTVETHRANLMRKLGLGNQTALVRYALRRGILF